MEDSSRVIFLLINQLYLFDRCQSRLLLGNVLVVSGYSRTFSHVGFSITRGSRINNFKVQFYRVQVGIQSPEGITTTRTVLRRFNDFLKLHAAVS